jgi:hypothetical protein
LKEDVKYKNYKYVANTVLSVLYIKKLHNTVQFFQSYFIQ